jgi:hypothetical protein
MVVQSHARTVMSALSGVGAGVRGGAHGWNADQFGRRLCLVPSTSSVSCGCGGRERGRVQVVVVGTLLGPEGTGRSGRWKAAGWGCFFVQCLMLVVPPGVPGLAVGDVGCLPVR